MFNKIKGLGSAAVATILVLSSNATAQIPGLPALQNAFVNPGLALAANFGSGSGQSLFAVAGAYGLGSGRFAISGAAGAQRANEATRGAYGGRASFTAWTSSRGSFGLGAFAGAGVAPRTRNDAGFLTNAAMLTIPAGITAGWRRPMGRTRGLSVYAAPLYRWTRLETDLEGSSSEGTVRVATGLDFSFTPSFGITLGGEFGSGDTDANVLGVAVSWVRRSGS